MSPRFAFACVAVLAALSGCFPIELEVTREGGIIVSRQEGWFLFDPATNAVRKLRDAGDEWPVVAKLSPDGQTLLTVAEVAGGQADFDFVIGPVGGGETRRLLRTRNPTYVLWSPTGSSIALTRMTTSPHEPGASEELLELALLNPQTGEARVVLQEVSPEFRWLPDGRHILILTNPRGGDETLVDLVRLDVETGEAEPLVKVLAADLNHLDVSRDGQTAAICALDVAPLDQDLQRRDPPLPQVHLVELNTRAIRRVETYACFSAFSPSGKRLLVCGLAEGGSGVQPAALEVVDVPSGESVVITENAVPAATPEGDFQAYPGWIDEERIYYFTERAIYGTQSWSLGLMLIQRDGSGARCVQPAIDQFAIEND